jgi:hypothetical protein
VTVAVGEHRGEQSPAEVFSPLAGFEVWLPKQSLGRKEPRSRSSSGRSTGPGLSLLPAPRGGQSFRGKDQPRVMLAGCNTQGQSPAQVST